MHNQITGDETRSIGSSPDEILHAREKQRVALSSVAAALLLTGLKIVVGISTGSLGILSEALHSALDLVAAAITLFAVRSSARPADSRHLYGHGKVENLSALFETALLLVTCAWIVYEAIRRLFFAEIEVEPTIWAFAVMAVSIVVDVSRSRALRRVAVATRSQALEADALHFATDVWSSAVVIVGLGLVWLARELDRPELIQGDAIAALAVAGIVMGVGLRLGRRSVGILLDEVPPGLQEELTEAARVDGVRDVLRLRVRQSGPESFVDCALEVDPSVSLEHGHAIAERAETAVRTVLDNADVVVHLEPAATLAETEVELPEAARIAALVKRLAAQHAGVIDVHDIVTTSDEDQLHLTCHLTVSATTSLPAAHGITEELEASMRRRLAKLGRVVIHIEPSES